MQEGRSLVSFQGLQATYKIKTTVTAISHNIMEVGDSLLENTPDLKSPDS